MAYTRLLRAYYHREQAIQAGQQYRLAKATTPTQRKAVDQVLAEFFELHDDGCYHQKRADEEIARYRETEPEREAKRVNERERQQRTRARRKELFDLLREAGVVPAYDAPMSELQTLASRHLSRVTSRDITEPVTRDATATHTPDTNNQRIPSPPTPSSVTKPDKPPEAARVLLPDWVPQDDWVDFVAMRKAKGKRAPFTAAAEQGIVRQLERLRTDGHDPGEVLRQSTMNGWSGVFAPRPTGNVRPFASRQAEIVAKHFPRIAAKPAQEPSHVAFALG
jgi:uncharacterized protein YdaU (DUF1376 family)